VAGNTKQKFEAWYSQWLEDNVVSEGASLCEQWLLGQDYESDQQSEKHTELYAGRKRSYYQRINK